MSETRAGLSRRAFISSATAAGVGAVALAGPARAEVPAAVPVAPAPAAAKAAATGAKKLEEVLRVGNRIVVLRDRQIVTILDPDVVTFEMLLAIVAKADADD